MKETTIFIAQSPTPTQQQSPVPAPLIQTGIDWTAVLVPLLPAVFTGVITGLIAPVIAPYTKWHLEKERRRHERRLQLIDTWRNYLQESNEDEDFLEPYSLMSLSSFPAIERCMSPDKRRKNPTYFRPYREIRYRLRDNNICIK